MVMTIGHRGAAGIAPENTLKGFDLALTLGIDFVECDLHLTLDNQLVVIHDQTVDRTTNGQGAVAELRADQIRQLDAGDGERVPFFYEVLELVQGRGQLLCELKGPGTETATVDAVRRQHMTDQVIFIAFQMERLARVRDLGTSLRIGPILPDPTDAQLAQASALDAVGIGVNYRNVSLALIDKVHAAGLQIRAWNPDSWREQRIMIDMGVDGVGTNYPDRLLANVNRLF